jgi:hypothetical protein
MQTPDAQTTPHAPQLFGLEFRDTQAADAPQKICPGPHPGGRQEIPLQLYPIGQSTEVVHEQKPLGLQNDGHDNPN